MRNLRGFCVALSFVLAGIGGTPARAEVVEEIVAKVNDDIITMSELRKAEEEILAEIYRRFTGAELDRELKKAREQLLRRMIDRKILLHRAERMFDVAKLGDAILQSFKEQQGIASDEELARLLAAENLSVADLKKRLIDMYAPNEVERYEVADRVSVGEKEIRAWYDEHLEEFRAREEATVREIVLLAEGKDRAAVREDAERIRARAAAPGADFAAIAAETSDAGTKKDGGLLGVVSRGDLAPALERAAFATPPGEVSPVLEAEHGFHILKVESRTDATLRSFEDVREEIRKRLYERKFDEAYAEFLKKAWAEAEIWVAPKYIGRLSRP